MAFMNDVLAPKLDLSARIYAAIEAVSGAWRAYQVRRKTYAELSSLSSRDLADLGIHRSEIARIAYEAGQNA